MVESLPIHKLCGFLRTVVRAIDLSGRDHAKALEFGTLCHTFSNGTDVGFKSETGVLLAPILHDSNHGGLDTASSSGSGKGRKSEKEAGSLAPSKRKQQMKRSVVQLIHGLVMNKCLKVEARVVGVVVVGENGGEVRVLVLVDVYLPVALWSGWQFPKSASKAAELFRHLR